MRNEPTAELLDGLNEVETRYAPASLYTLGREELLKRRPRISVIGTRQPSANGVELARSVASTVVGMGGVVVSGLALGIDRVAHEAAIAAGGDTIAVLGTPVHRSYPRENAKLQAQLAERFLVVSQFGPTDTTSRKSFIMRNRTMALLSHGSTEHVRGARFLKRRREPR